MSAFGFEIVGDPFAKDMGRRVEGGFGFDLDHGLSVGCDDLGDHAPFVRFDLTGGNAVGADGKLTASAEGVEGGALGFDAVAGVGVLEEGDGLTDVGVTFAIDGVVRVTSLEGERSLSGCRAHLFR